MDDKKPTDQEIREGEERKANSGETIDRDATQPNSNPTAHVPASGVETPGQAQPVEKNRIEVPDVSHAAETSTEEKNEADEKKEDEA